MRGPRSLLAFISGKALHQGLTTLGRGATALPGLVALAIDPHVTRGLAASLAHGAVAVTGTNGKTTTSRMLAEIARAAGWHPVHNRAGANLARGIASALLADARWTGGSRSDFGIFEVDEASVPRVMRVTAPRVVVVTNLFRDQLDRYFELDALARRIGDAVAELPAETTLVLNADDPLVTYIGDRHRGTVAFFGVDDASWGEMGAPELSDVTRCPRCRSPLEFRSARIAHLGDWRCTRCDFARPLRDVSATSVKPFDGGIVLTVDGRELRVPIAGAYNAYNAVAALAAARALGVANAVAEGALAAVQPAFGRQEIVRAAGRRIRLLLVKNPAGFDAAVESLPAGNASASVLFALNDNDADGRDVSWIWDARFERVAPVVASAVVSGTRAADLALRLKYASVERTRVRVVEGWSPAIDAALELTPAGGDLYVVATYTAMLALRAELARRGLVAPFWED